MPPDLLYFLASTSNTKRSSNSSISKERYNWRALTEDGAAGSYSNPYTRDETRPVAPPCLENSTLTYIAQRPAHVHVSRRARARTPSPRSLPAAGALHALTQPAHPVGRPRPCFFCCVLLHVFRGVILDLTFLHSTAARYLQTTAKKGRRAPTYVGVFRNKGALQ